MTVADFQTAAPTEPKKTGDYLHDRSRIPARPKRGPGEYFGQYSGYLMGVLLAIAVTALVFQLRDAWESHRDWVPPAAMVPAILGALALGHLAQRGRVNAIAVPVGLLFVAVLGPMLDLWLDETFPEQDGLALTFTIISAVALGLATIWLLVAVLFVEATDPQEPPAAEE
jgi:hypothetical protein